MIVTWSSAKGSPGVSSWMWLTGAAWPVEAGSGERVLVEADLDGGVMPARLSTGTSPGLAELVGAASRGEGVRLDECAHRIDDAVWAVPAPADAATVRHVLSNDAVLDMSAALQHDPRVWLLDVGRHAASEMLPVTASSRVTVVVSRPEMDSLVASQLLVGRLSQHCPVLVAVVGKCAYGRGELREFMGVPVTGLPEQGETVTASELCWGQRRVRRRGEFRAANELASTIQQMARGVISPGDEVVDRVG